MCAADNANEEPAVLNDLRKISASFLYAQKSRKIYFNKKNPGFAVSPRISLMFYDSLLFSLLAYIFEIRLANFSGQNLQNIM